MGRLSTHVLDTSRGTPATGLRIELFRLDGGSPTAVTSAFTNADGRTPEPLLTDNDLLAGVYELVFHVAEYYRALRVALPDPPFLDRVVIRFGIADPSSNWHVPLLLSPYGYSTYRGS